MSAKKIIAVVGATGAQGGGLVRAIAADQDSGFAARALTRDVNSEKARDLQKLGVEVVAADVDDRTSLERAFKGAYGASVSRFFGIISHLNQNLPMRGGGSSGGWVKARHLVHA